MMQKKDGIKRKKQRSSLLVASPFLLPSLIFFVGFVIIPMVICILTSLTDANMHTAGLGNFVGL